jgi:hypothetical protein
LEKSIALEQMLSPVDLIEERDKNCLLKRQRHRKANRPIDCHGLTGLKMFNGNTHIPIDILDNHRDKTPNLLEE